MRNGEVVRLVLGAVKWHVAAFQDILSGLH